jgi:hypothetical protein
MTTSTTSLYDTYMELCDQYGEKILNWADPTNEFRGYTNVRSILLLYRSFLPTAEHITTTGLVEMDVCVYICG